MKKKAIILSLLIILVITISIVKDVMIKGAIENIVFLSTGLKMDIKELKVSILKTFISIKDMVVLNPDHFNDRMMLYMPEIYIDYDLPALFRKKIHLKNVRINLKEFTIIKNQDGKRNIDYIKNLKKQGKPSQEQKGSPKSANLQIDSLALKIEKIIYKDYSGGEKPKVSEYKINIDARYKNLKNANEIVRLIIAKAMVNTAIDTLLDVERIKDIPLDTLESGKDILKNLLPFKE